MIHSLAHRGPDGCEMWHAGPVGLGHCALHTTPEAVETKQPIADHSGRFVLTADARIDNRTELISALDWADRPVASIGDAELILGAYKKWGQECPKYLLGTFAFALWDGCEQHLFSARDRVGVRPFYYHRGASGTFAFGTEIKALLSLDVVPNEINEVRVAEFLAKTSTDTEITFYRDILRLPPAHTLCIRRKGTMQLRRYWTLDPERETRLPSDKAYEERFLELFTEAVRCRLRTNSPAGVMVSGGLDSSSVACVARDLLAEEEGLPLNTFSGVFPDLPPEERKIADESEYLDALEAQGGFNMHRVALDKVSPLQDIESVIWHLDRPPFICNVYLRDILFKRARNEGIRVFLDGTEGDVTVSYGVAYLGELLLERKWEKLETELAALASRHGSTVARVFNDRLAPLLNIRGQQSLWGLVTQDLRRTSQLSGQSRVRLLWQLGLRPRLGEPFLHAIDWLRGRDRADEPMYPIISRDLLERTQLSERLADQRPTFKPQSYSARHKHWSSLHHDAGSIAVILEEVNHLAAMRGGEHRHPFYDTRLMEYCLSLPPDQKLKQGWTRSILRRAMHDVLPTKIQRRTSKADLSPNFTRNLIQDLPVDKLLAHSMDILKPYVDVSVLQNMDSRKNAPTYWGAVALSIWLHQRKNLRRGQDAPSCARSDSHVA